MCACDWNYVCSKCAGDPRQDFRVQFTLEPRTRKEEEAEQAYWAWRTERDPARLA
jgi:hypothetical protein